MRRAARRGSGKLGPCCELRWGESVGGLPVLPRLKIDPLKGRRWVNRKREAEGAAAGGGHQRHAYGGRDAGSADHLHGDHAYVVEGRSRSIW